MGCCVVVVWVEERKRGKKKSEEGVGVLCIFRQQTRGVDPPRLVEKERLAKRAATGWPRHLPLEVTRTVFR